MVWLVLAVLGVVGLVVLLRFGWHLIVMAVQFLAFVVVGFFQLIWIGLAALFGHKRKDRGLPWTVTEPVEPPLWERPRTYDDDEVVYTRPPDLR